MPKKLIPADAAPRTVRPHSAGKVPEDDVTYPIQSVDRALLLLREFLVRPAITVSDAGEMLGVSKSTAHRLLAMLQRHGFVRQDGPTKAYLGGSTLLEIGLSQVGRLDIRAAAQSSLDALVAETGETAHLVILQPPNVLFFDGRESPRAVRAGLRLGVTLPAQCSSAGKAILAGLTMSEIKALWGRRELTALTPRSITSWDALQVELEVVRSRGWAVNTEESEEGLRTVGAAVGEPGGQSPIRAALVVAAPAQRLGDDRLQPVAAAVTREAALVASRLASD